MNGVKEVLKTQVRVTTGKAGGSGTVIYARLKDRYYSTYVITCHHVVSDLLKVVSKWDSMLGMERKVENRQQATVEFFDWDTVPHGKSPLTSGVWGQVVAYDPDHDMALIHMQLGSPPAVAPLFPEKEIENLRVLSPVIIVGCALLHDPIVTQGIITHMGDVIDYKDYWMSNAQIIFGNSGGSVFTADAEGRYKFIGIPSRIDIAGWNTPITHLGYFSPITRVYEFLRSQIFDFIIPDSGQSEEECAANRKLKREEEERKLRLPEKPTNEK